MKKNDFRQKMLEMHKNDADIYKIKKKHNDLGTNSKISLITYNTNNELLIIKETDSNEPIQVIKTSKDNLDLSDDTKLTTESLNLNSNNFSVKEIEKILPTVDTIIKDTDDKLYGISFGKIKQIGVSDSIDDSVSVKDLNRWVEKAFNYDVVDKEFNDTAIVYNKFHYHDYHYNHKLRKNKLQVSDEFGDTELLVLSKEIMHTMQHGTEEEKYSIIFDRYSLNKNTRYRLLSTAQIVEYGAYITYFDGLNNRHGELIETMENGDKKFHVYHPSNVVKGINAVESNTYTYEFELICSPDNSFKNFKFLQKRDYCRVVENGTFENYYRTSITKIANGVYKYIGSTDSNIAKKDTIMNRYGEVKSGTPDNPTGDVSYEIYLTATNGTDSGVAKGISAVSSNTYTKRFTFKVNKYNKVITNGDSAGSDYTYSRVVESNVFKNFHRSPVAKVATGVYKYIGSTTENATPNTTLASTSNTAASGTTAGIHRGYCELKSGAETGAATYHIYDASYCTGIKATASNTKTTPYILTVDKYNKVTNNCTATTVLNYARIIENNTFKNYYRSPVTQTGSYNIYTLNSGTAAYNSSGTSVTLNSSLNGKNGELKSGSNSNPTGDYAYEIYNASYGTGINADSNNTYTNRYTLKLNKYNAILTNLTSAGSYDYGRVVESNSKFVNYLRNPIERGLTHTVDGHTIKFVSLDGTNLNYYIYKSNECLTSTEVSWEWHGLQYRKYVHDYYTTWYYNFDKYNVLNSLYTSSTRRDRWWDD